MPASEDNPKMLYIRIEERLAPLLRTALAEHLPEVGGDDWWDVCVVPALTSVQADHLRPEHTFEQFDYPALVSILYRNWRSLRSVIGAGDELTNYLFTVKTFRNDAAHQPDLVLSPERRAHIIQAAELAEALLGGDSVRTKPPRPVSPQSVLGRFKAPIIAASVFLLLAAGTLAVFRMGEESAKEAAQALQRMPTSAEARRDFLKGLPDALKEEEIQVCLRYRRADDSWSKFYTTRGYLKSGRELNQLLGADRFASERQHLIIHWRRTDDRTVIPLAVGEVRPPDESADYRDVTLRRWQVQAGWDGCRNAR